MDRHRFRQARDTGVGQRDSHTAPVPGDVRPEYQTLINQSRDAASQPRARDERAGGKVSHPQLAARAGQLSQDVEVGEAEPDS